MDKDPECRTVQQATSSMSSRCASLLPGVVHIGAAVDGASASVDGASAGVFRCLLWWTLPVGSVCAIVDGAGAAVGGVCGVVDCAEMDSATVVSASAEANHAGAEVIGILVRACAFFEQLPLPMLFKKDLFALTISLDDLKRGHPVGIRGGSS